ncbi:uncharacterized protein [Haliotis asinina]|uniref:uncharacterized protein n=1 Tax=Haliotis asinina TaxID=109174 RepID=UPI003531FA56
MTAGSVFTSSLTPGIYVPRWNRYTPCGLRETREVKSSYSYTDTSGVTSPLRILGATSNVNGRRVQSSFAPTISMKADSRDFTSLTLKAIYSKSNKKSIEPLPLRPAMTRAKQVPGRYFPKAILTDEHKMAIACAKPTKPIPVRKESFPPIKGLDFMKTSLSLLPPQSRTSHNASFNPKIAHTRKSLRMFPEVPTEVFAISFPGDAKQEYDPKSELHSDYYSITRVNVNSAKEGHAAKNQAKAQSSSSNDFRVVLRGHRKLLHDRGDEKDDDEEELDVDHDDHDETSKKESEAGLPQI